MIPIHNACARSLMLWAGSSRSGSLGQIATVWVRISMFPVAVHSSHHPERKLVVPLFIFLSIFPRVSYWKNQLVQVTITLGPGLEAGRRQPRGLATDPSSFMRRPARSVPRVRKPVMVKDLSPAWLVKVGYCHCSVR